MRRDIIPTSALSLFPLASSASVTSPARARRAALSTAGQKRGVTDQIKRDFKRRAAIEPVIGHLKDDHRLGRNYLAHAAGDASNAVLAAAGYNFRRLIRWLRLQLLKILAAFWPASQIKPA